MLGLGSLDADFKRQKQAFSGMSPQQLTQIANPMQQMRPNPTKGITPDLLKALAAQKLLKEKQAYEASMYAAMEQDPNTVVSQIDQELEGRTQKDMVDSVGKILTNRQNKKNKAQQAISKLDANVLKRLGQKPRQMPRQMPMQRSAQGGIVKLANGGSVNDPYGIGALGELGIPRFDYSTNQDRSLITLLKNILKGGMLKPENRPAPANNEGIVSNIRPFVPINTGESAKESLARRAAEKQQRGTDKQLNLLRQAQDSSVETPELASAINNLTASRDTGFGDQTDPKNRFPGSDLNFTEQDLGYGGDSEPSVVSKIGGISGILNKLKDLSSVDNPYALISEEKRKDDTTPELVDQELDTKGPAIDGETDEIADQQLDEEINNALNTEVNSSDEPRVVDSKIDTYNNALERLAYALSSGFGRGQATRRDIEYTQMINDRLNKAAELKIRRRSVKVQEEMVDVTREGNLLDFLRRGLDTISTNLAEARATDYETSTFGTELMAARQVLAGLESGTDAYNTQARGVAELERAFELNFKSKYTEEYARYDAYARRLKSVFGIDITKQKEEESEFDLNRDPD